MKTKVYYKDGVQVTMQNIDGIKGRVFAFLKFKGNDKAVALMATFPTLLRTKVDVYIKEHYSNVIAGLAKTAREINNNARKAA